MVNLHWWEVYQAAITGVMRHVKSIQDNRKSTPYMDSEYARWGVNVEGAIAECAFAKAFGMYWGQSVDTFKEPDVGNRVQVRQTEKDTHCLIVKEKDNDNHIYVLLIGSRGHYWIVGWILGKDAKQKKWIFDPRKTGVVSYFVPQSELHPIETIREVL